MIFDVIFLSVFAWAAYKGYTKGFILQAATLAALLLGILGAIKFSGFTADLLIHKFNLEGKYVHLVSFTLTFIIIIIAVHFVARLIEKLIELINLSFLNRLAGILFSLIKYAFILSICLTILNSIHRRFRFLPEKQIHDSFLYVPLSVLAPMIFPYLHFDRQVPDDNTPALENNQIIV